MIQKCIDKHTILMYGIANHTIFMNPYNIGHFETIGSKLLKPYILYTIINCMDLYNYVPTLQ